MKKLMLLINPNAGRGGFRLGLADVLQVFHEAGYRSTVFFTDGRGDATELAAAHAAEYDRVVCVGGDGTLSETISGLMLCPDRPTLGYIPMGTTNDVAQTLKLSRIPGAAARTAVRGREKTLDVGLFNDSEYFTYVAAFGAFTEVSYETPQPQKQALGRLAYFLSGIASLGRLTHRKAKVEWDGGTVEGDFIFGGVTNSRSVAGLVRLRDVDDEALSDGEFEVLLVRTPMAPGELATAISDILSNRFTGDQILLLRSTFVRFTFDEPVLWTRDGEPGGDHLTVTCRNLPSPIRIITD